MLNAYFERDRAAARASGGEVHQIVGDEVMAIFNKQGDMPDHPVRAARAALLLQAEQSGSRQPTRNGRRSASA